MASLTALGLEPPEVLFCGDTVIDGSTPGGLALPSAGCSTAPPPLREFQTRRIPCDHVAGDLWDLGQWLASTESMSPRYSGRPTGGRFLVSIFVKPGIYGESGFTHSLTALKDNFFTMGLYTDNCLRRHQNDA